MDRPQHDHSSVRAPDARLVVIVARSGGITGMTRQWRAEPSADETARWLALIEDCPWDDPDGPRVGADRFEWRIRVLTGSHAREARVPDADLAGPWRVLVDEVRGSVR